VYVILVYDVGVERVNKVLKICRMYLMWVQNSVLEGEISEADLIRLRQDLLEVIDVTTDSVSLYLMTKKYNDKFVLGKTKGELSTIL
jgi:CRISPR-associated protein Cas2